MRRGLGLLAMLLAATPAMAADVVLYASGDPGEAVIQAGRDAERDPGELRATTLTELLRGRPPVLQGDGTIEVCARVPASAEAFEEALSEAEASMAYMEYDQALTDLDEAADLLGCLATPADPDSSGRLYYLRGLVFYFSGEEMAAKAAWAQAHRFHTDLAWDDNFPPDGKPLFEEARARVDADAPANLTLVPVLSDETVWVDGRAAVFTGARIALPAGDHLVQFGTASVTTVRIALDPAAEATLIFPHAVTDDAVGWVADNDQRAMLSSVLAATLSDDAKVYAVWDGTTWSGTAGSPVWDPLESREAVAAVEPEPAPEPEPEPVTAPAPDLEPLTSPVEPKKKRTWYLTIGGASLFAVSGALAMVSYSAASTAAADASNTTDFADYKQYEEKYDRSGRAYYAFTGLAIGGAALAVTGIFVPISDGVRIGPTHNGIRVTVRR